jgi:hypothetical protein
VENMFLSCPEFLSKWFSKTSNGQSNILYWVVYQSRGFLRIEQPTEYENRDNSYKKTELFTGIMDFHGEVFVTRNIFLWSVNRNIANVNDIVKTMRCAYVG